MKTRFKVMRVLFVLGIAVLFISGCASTRVNLVDNGMLSIERVPSEGIYVSSVYAFKEGDDLVISGKVKRSKNTASPSGGHIDIGVFSPDGKAIKEVSTSYTPRIIKRKGARESSFTARISGVPPKNSKIRVVYHRLSYLADSTFDCGNNAATH